MAEDNQTSKPTNRPFTDDEKKHGKQFRFEQPCGPWDIGSSRPCMDDIFRISRNNQAVHSIMHCWLSGEISLEQALIYMVIELSARNDKLQNIALETMQRAPFAVTVKNTWEGWPTPPDAVGKAKEIRNDCPASDEPLPDKIIG